MKNYFSIGELSKYQNISKQTLIFYDKIDLFKPAYIDPHNKYRYYSVSQMDYLDTILIMKRIGFSLDEIREHMKHSNIDSSLLLLRKQLTVIEHQLEELNLIKSRLLHRCAQMESAKKFDEKKAPIQREHINEKYILFHDIDAPYSTKEISISTKKCFSQAFQNKLPVFFQAGVIVPLDHIKAGRFTESTKAFLTTEKTDLASNIITLPEGECISIYHFGRYDMIDESYKALLRHCKDNNLEIISDSYEFCINDYITSSNEEDFITKIMFYIK